MSEIDMRGDINLQKETPLYRVIDDPELPLLPMRENLLKIVVISSALALFLMTGFLTFKTLSKNKSYGEHAA